MARRPAKAEAPAPQRIRVMHRTSVSRRTVPAGRAGFAHRGVLGVPSSERARRTNAREASRAAQATGSRLPRGLRRGGCAWGVKHFLFHIRRNRRPRLRWGRGRLTPDGEITFHAGGVGWMGGSWGGLTGCQWKSQVLPYCHVRHLTGVSSHFQTRPTKTTGTDGCASTGVGPRWWHPLLPAALAALTHGVAGRQPATLTLGGGALRSPVPQRNIH